VALFEYDGSKMNASILTLYQLIMQMLCVSFAFLYIYLSVCIAASQAEVVTINSGYVSWWCSQYQKSEKEAEISVETFEQQLFVWCIENSECTRIYHQEEFINKTIFSYLASSTVFQYGDSVNLHSELYTLLCNGEEEEETASESNLFNESTVFIDAVLTERMTKKVWIARLLANRADQLPECDVNHRLVVNYDSLTAQCECIEQRQCSDTLFNNTYFYVISITILVVVLLFAVGSFYQMSQSLTSKATIRKNTNEIGCRVISDM